MYIRLACLFFHVLSVDGYWEPWQEWQPCNVSCGGGIQIRERDCVEPLHGGETCPGPSDETRDCNTHSCPGGFYIERYFHKIQIITIF